MQAEGQIQISRGKELAYQASISAEKLSVHAGDGKKRIFLLSDIDVKIPERQFTVIIGVSGCGKTTLLKALSGAQSRVSGDVLLVGYSVQELQSYFSLAISYLPQVGAFHPDLNVIENLNDASSLRLPRNISSSIRHEWIKNIIDLSGLNELLRQSYQTLSGGQMRRMALAESLIGDPAFLFLDELTSGLDVYSELEIMQWLRDLAHVHGKNVVLVTHSTHHLHLCDSIIFLHQGRLAHHGSYESLLEKHGVSTITEVFALYQTGEAVVSEAGEGLSEDIPRAEPQPLKTARPPSGFWQFPTLLRRQARLFWRDKGQLWLHLALIVTFPCLVAVFAIHGLPQVRDLNLALDSNILHTLEDQLLYLKESFHAASVISGLTMFQVVLLTLIGANNGAREIAKEDEILKKELRAGLSPTAYIASKFVQIVCLCLVQSFWMAWFVKSVCGFPGGLLEQFGILFAGTLAMSTACLAISAAAPSPERASLLAIYLVGFQLPLSGAALALPDWLSHVCRPFIVAYWGWSGYLQTFQSTRNYDIVKQATHTVIADYRAALVVLLAHIVLSLALADYFVRRKRNPR